MKIIEYKLHRTHAGAKVTPGFVYDGGYFPHEYKLIGICADDSIWLPGTVQVFTEEQLVARVITMDIGKPLSDEQLTGAEKRQMALAWIAEMEALWA